MGYMGILKIPKAIFYLLKGDYKGSEVQSLGARGLGRCVFKQQTRV